MADNLSPNVFEVSPNLALLQGQKEHFPSKACLTFTSPSQVIGHAVTDTL